ncbi:NAD(P)H-hydrate dehydratase [Algibacillus agarilyticus]|uniref:NAD(P)H-hydrate dehydratase n=1 Tax=Algibacillus agarilyticus TaxID=2234133 RepID=UPI000DD0C611|nr:NAD(P)H-hydrate dehydratase [Algibacillus agarilyticus]
MTTTSQFTRVLPVTVYTPEQVRLNEPKAAEQAGLTLYELMQAAGGAAFNFLQSIYPLGCRLGVVCGSGNNAGDGYIVAYLAKLAGWPVTVVEMPGVSQLKQEALLAQQAYVNTGATINSIDEIDLSSFEIIVDAVLGTGTERVLSAEWSNIINEINTVPALTVSLDIPSGLNAYTGAMMGAAIEADHTVTFIALKSGLLTAQAADHIGVLYFAGLDVNHIFDAQNKAYYYRSDWDALRSLLPTRKRTSYKTQFGKVVCIGGDKGMAGAIKMASEACLRAGAGLVTVLTHPDNVLQVASGRPELMVYGVNGLDQDVLTLLDNADVVLAGPGMGRSGWAHGFMSHIVTLDKPMIIDADALNWLANQPHKNRNWILTPHVGEAARLLAQNGESIELDRFSANFEICARYGGVSILKGAGSLISSSQQTHICTAGNPGMATGGMGDVLAGITAAIVAQKSSLGLSLFQAAELAVCLHAKAGDLAAKQGERGMIASDLIHHIRTLVNPS